MVPQKSRIQILWKKCIRQLCFGAILFSVALEGKLDLTIDWIVSNDCRTLNFHNFCHGRFPSEIFQIIHSFADLEAGVERAQVQWFWTFLKRYSRLELNSKSLTWTFNHFHDKTFALRTNLCGFLPNMCGFGLWTWSYTGSAKGCWPRVILPARRVRAWVGGFIIDLVCVQVGKFVVFRGKVSNKSSFENQVKPWLLSRPSGFFIRISLGWVWNGISSSMQYLYENFVLIATVKFSRWNRFPEVVSSRQMVSFASFFHNNPPKLVRLKTPTQTTVFHVSAQLDGRFRFGKIKVQFWRSLSANFVVSCKC